MAYQVIQHGRIKGGQGTGTPIGKSQVLWVSIRNVGPSLEPWKMIVSLKVTMIVRDFLCQMDLDPHPPHPLTKIPG